MSRLMKELIFLITNYQVKREAFLPPQYLWEDEIIFKMKLVQGLFYLLYYNTPQNGKADILKEYFYQHYLHKLFCLVISRH